MLRRLLLSFILLVTPAALLAQDAPAALIADQMEILSDQTLVASGNVEVFYNGAHLKASKITYNSATGRLTIEGPLILTDGADMIFLADQAELSDDLSNGILTSARLVLDQQLQLAANEIARVSGRYTAMNRVVASSCQVCLGRPTPLWEIRSRRVVHDQQTSQLYFEDAQFRIAGVPVFYIPRLRMPDPTVTRSSGFLAPVFRSTSQLGTGIKLPYFIAIADDRDLTLTPYISTRGTRTLDWRYRQAFRTGELQFDGALTSDKVLADEARGYFFGVASFALPRDYVLGLQVQTVSDDAYLLDYAKDDLDTLVSEVEITRTRSNEHIEARLAYNNSLRDSDVNANLPSLVSDLSFHRRFSPAWLGGEGGFRFQTHSHRRSSNADGDDGRDVARASARVDWRRNWVLQNGMIASAMSQITADFYAISQDSAYPGTVTRVAPVAAVELRWPLVRHMPSGAAQVLEPVVQLVWAPDKLDDVPNEDSILVEFDEGNLFALSRFPGADAQELGFRANLGLSWTRLDPTGWSLALALGRVFRAEDLGQFSLGTGLAGVQSDWLLATQLTTADGLTLTNRALLDNDFGFTRDELRLAWAGKRLGLATSYLWLDADLSENRPNDSSELVLDAAYRLTDTWTASLDTRYDFVTDRATRAGLGLKYQSECVELDLSLSRRFTSSTSVEPTTSVNLSVALSGFGARADGTQYRRSCGQ